MNKEIIYTIILGILEGLTEFIPVSSTGHLILASELLTYEMQAGFEIIIQLGAILAVCWVYKERLFFCTVNLGRDKKANRFALNLLVAFLPSMVIGFFAHSFIKEILFSPLVVSISLVIGGVIILLIEKFHKAEPKHNDVDEFNIWLALKIGFCQVLAMIPGTSRSGATIMGALLLGVNRKAATEFSFFLAIPTMVGATVYDIYKNWEFLNTGNITLIAVGFATAFLSALVVVKTVVSFVSKNGFTPFGWYRIIVGAIMLYMFWG